MLVFRGRVFSAVCRSLVICLWWTTAEMPCGNFLSVWIFGLRGLLLRGNPAAPLEKARLTAENFKLKGVAGDVALRTTIIWGPEVCPQEPPREEEHGEPPFWEHRVSVLSLFGMAPYLEQYLYLFSLMSPLQTPACACWHPPILHVFLCDLTPCFRGWSVGFPAFPMAVSFLSRMCISVLYCILCVCVLSCMFQ